MRQNTWQRAAAYAARMHQHERRDDDETPYFSHPARVAMTVAHLFGCTDEAAIAAAFLHDVVENTGESYEDVSSQFGTEVADLVVALTKNTMLPQSRRNADYDKRLRAADWRARLVKLADVYDNFIDTQLGAKKGRADVAAKYRKTIALARADARSHPESRRAIALVRALVSAPRRGKSR